jgi:P-type E1-E2 ATPase
MKYIESDLTLAASFGLADTIRDQSSRAIEELYKSGVTTRLVTGGHKNSAIHVAKKVLQSNQAISGADMH